jgi:hypothetical protein
MKKLTALLATVLIALPVIPAQAGKAKHVSGSIEATLLPFPKLAAWGDPAGLTSPGCTAGQEDVHWAAEEFTSPGKGKLRFYAEGFTGDWDLYIFDGDQVLYRSEASQVPDQAAPEEEISMRLKKGQVVTLVVCNWLGDPNVVASYEGHFK